MLEKFELCYLGLRVVHVTILQQLAKQLFTGVPCQWCLSAYTQKIKDVGLIATRLERNLQGRNYCHVCLYYDFGIWSGIIGSG